MPRTRRRPASPLIVAAAALASVSVPGLIMTPLAAAAQAPAATATAAPAVATPSISVIVDGEPITFTGQGPIMDPSGSTVLVPLRGVFEKLGAGVQYTPATKTITAVKGDTTVILRLGDPNATVNGTVHPLAVPPETVQEVTLVPLRFVSEALGADVKWDPASQTVAIATPKPVDTSPLTGPISAVDVASRTITVHPTASDKDVPVVLTPDATVLLKAGDAPAVAAPDLSALHVGDLVTIKRDPTGLGFSLEADYAEARGTVKAVDAMPASGNPKITFADDTTAEIAPGAPVTRDNAAIALTDIIPGQKAVLHLNPQTRLALAVAVEAPKLEITSITQSAGTRMLKFGDEVTVTLVGTPGAKATYTVPGLLGFGDQPLTESTETPGAYTATFKVPGETTLQNGVVTGSLSLAGGVSMPAQSAPGLTIDSVGPAVADLLPASGSNGTSQRPSISGTYKDQDTGSGIDVAATRVFVNGKDVTAASTIQKTFFVYKPETDLPPGDNTVTVVTRDLAGNETRKEWTFTITPIANPIKVVTLPDVPEDRPLAAGETLTIRAEAQAGGSARYTVGKNGTISGSLVEQSPGVYVGTYTVHRGDSLTREPVTVFFRPVGVDTESSLVAARTVSISAGAPKPPTIDLPAEGASVGDFVVLSGRGTPNTKVRIDLSYNGKVFLLNTKAGGNLPTLDIVVDASGAWKSDPIVLNADRDLRGVTFTAEAITIAGNGDKSDPVVVHFSK